MSLIILPTKKVNSVLYVDQEVIGGDAVEFSAAVNKLVMQGWGIDGKPLIRGNYLVQPMSKVIEIEVGANAN